MELAIHGMSIFVKHLKLGLASLANIIIQHPSQSAHRTLCFQILIISHQKKVSQQLKHEFYHLVNAATLLDDRFVLSQALEVGTLESKTQFEVSNLLQYVKSIICIPGDIGQV